MVSENQREEITVSDGLQLGRSTVDTTDIKTAEDEVNTLQKQVDQVNCPPSPMFLFSPFLYIYMYMLCVTVCQCS
jgi:hypothetical protein